MEKSFKEHSTLHDDVLKTLIEHGFKIKPSKTQLAVKKTDFHGFTISARGIEPQKGHLVGIRNLEAPKKVKEVQSFNGLINYFGAHIPDCSNIQKPLSALTRKKVFHWTKIC